LGGGSGRFGHDEYAHFYWAQAVYTLGEDGYAKLFPGTKPADCLTWSGYRKANFPNLIKSQNEDGTWTGNSPWARFGAVYTTSIHLAILEVGKGVPPIIQRLERTKPRITRIAIDRGFDFLERSAFLFVSFV